MVEIQFIFYRWQLDIWIYAGPLHIFRILYHELILTEVLLLSVKSRKINVLYFESLRFTTETNSSSVKLSGV